MGKLLEKLKELQEQHEEEERENKLWDQVMEIRRQMVTLKKQLKTVAKAVEALSEEDKLEKADLELDLERPCHS